jgi:glycine betaine/proline transport system ATP-binding protein
MASKVSVRNLYKIFGSEPERALEMLKEGRSKEDILSETGQTVGVQDVSFDVEAGEVFVVMGLSGSGKSTLVRMLNRLISATSGEITLDGEDIVHADDETLRKIRLEKVSMVFQHFALFPHMSVCENVEYGLKIRGMDADERRERALIALDQVGLKPWADRLPNALSGGMQQRVGLARGLATDAEILLMDEPFSALDPLIRRDMQHELLQLEKELHKTIIFITHDLNEALILGDQIAIMKEGRFVQVGTAEEIVGNPQDDYVADFTQDIDRSRVFRVDKTMVEAHALDLSSDTPESARERMEKLGRDALYVLDGEEIAGIVTHRGLGKSSGRKGAALSDALIRDYPHVEKGTLLYQLYGLCARGLPVAVLDKDGKLAGVAEPDAVFEQIAVKEAGPGEEDYEKAPEETGDAGSPQAASA